MPSIPIFICRWAPLSCHKPCMPFAYTPSAMHCSPYLSVTPLPSAIDSQAIPSYALSIANDPGVQGPPPTIVWRNRKYETVMNDPAIMVRVNRFSGTPRTPKFSLYQLFSRYSGRRSALSYLWKSNQTGSISNSVFSPCQ